MHTQRGRTENISQRTASAGSDLQREIPALLQEASDLLLLISDEPIWRSLLAGGLQGNARPLLARALSSARCRYKDWRSATWDPRCGLERDESLVQLQRIASLIRNAGCFAFARTSSLHTRFSNVRERWRIRTLAMYTAAKPLD